MDCGGQDIVAATLSESSKTVLEVMERLWKSGTVASSLTSVLSVIKS